MYTLSLKIEITGSRKWDIDFAHQVEVVRDMECLTDTCSITLPKRVKWDGESETPIKRGDGVKVWLGYDGQLELAFVGYVRDVGLKTPVVITCEDEMYRLKLTPAKPMAYRSVDLSTLLADQGLGSVKVMGEQMLGAYRVTDATVASLLGRLSENGIRSFYMMEGGGSVLYSGVLFERGTQPVQVFRTGLNIISDQNLTQQKAEAMRIKVKAVSLLPDNTKLKLELGDQDGELRTLHTYNKQEAELRAWAEQELKRLKVDGLTGSFTTFGFRLVDKLDNIGIIIDGQKMGVYQVKKNIIKFGVSGYRQEITLGYRVRS